MTPITDRFAEVLHLALKKRGEAARMSRDVGISQQNLSAVLAGRRGLDHGNTLKILEWLNPQQRKMIFAPREPDAQPQ